MLKRLLSKLTGNRQQIERHLKNQYQIEENGLSFPQSLVDDSELWALASWLEQLAEEDYLISLTDRWLLSWDDLYRLVEDEEHSSSLPLIGVPEVLPLRASLSSRGALNDGDFRVWVSEWSAIPSRQPIRFNRTGAIFTYENQQHLLSRENWVLLQAIEQLSTQQIQTPGETTNQLGWAAISKCAKQAAAKFDDYLEDTNSHEEMLHDDDLHEQVMDDDENEGISNKTTDENNDEKIDDANYREINESESLMQDKANDLKFNDEVNNSENQQNSSENNINNAVRNAVSSDIEYATNEDEENDERLAQDTNKEDQKLSQSEDIQHESLNNEDVSLTSNKT
ncbi:MAG: hypothetical protein E7E83_11145, partial [Enterobacter ludwigii]|nr:hypothetical protein [Enterobacter ludwigii]